MLCVGQQRLGWNFFGKWGPSEALLVQAPSSVASKHPSKTAFSLQSSYRESIAVTISKPDPLNTAVKSLSKYNETRKAVKGDSLTRSSCYDVGAAWRTHIPMTRRSISLGCIFKLSVPLLVSLLGCCMVAPLNSWIFRVTI